MPVVFIHVSDIHFGQERDHVVHIHDDVKRELIADAAAVVAGLPSRSAHGILVMGDIAYAGKAAEYAQAGKWLDSLAGAIGCPSHRVRMIPGNHDVDRDKLSIGGRHLLEFIREGGAAEYEQVMSNPNDRATLFARFENYSRFSIGYECGLDEEAKSATDLRFEVGPERWIRIVRLNSSLLCHGKERDDPPELVIGQRQFSIPRNPGEENVVLAHHPLHWYKDANDFRHYVRSRARIFITGHEHDPKVSIDRVEEGCDVMMLASGAAVPFRSDETYTHTYNILEFDWDEGTDSLVVTIYPRAWNPERTSFEADNKRLGGSDPRFTLGSPNFRKQGRAPTAPAQPDRDSVESKVVVELVPCDMAKADAMETASLPPDTESYELALLRFFRDLYESDRLRILVELEALPRESDERMTQRLERKLFDWLVRKGKLPDMVAMIDRLIGEREKKDA